MASPDAVKDDGKPVDPTVELPPTKKLNPGASKVDRDGTRAALVDRSLHKLDDWTRYKLEGGPSPKDAIPGIFITNTSTDEWKEIIVHFDLCPIAYPDNAEYFLLIDIARATFTKAAGERAFNELKARYASKGIAFPKRKLWGTEMFSSAAEKACEELRISRDEMNLMVLAPKQVMSYLGRGKHRAPPRPKDSRPQRCARAARVSLARRTGGSSRLRTSSSRTAASIAFGGNGPDDENVMQLNH